MKIRIFSDTHLDWYAECMHETRAFDPSEPKTLPPFWYPVEMPDDKETTLILAGDLWTGTKFIEYCGFSWIAEVSKQFKQVLIVLGNHCYWPQGDLTIKNGADKCNAMLQDMCMFNVKVLDCDTFEAGDVLFVGATLWTDMDKFNPLAMMNMERYMAYDGKIKYETGPNGYMTRFTSEKWISTHIKHRDYIKHVVEQNRDKKVVVITHHIPLNNLTDPIFANDPGNAYYSSDLSGIILDNPNVKLWAFGHTHYGNDVMFEHCRMYNNCVGYQSEHKEQCGLVRHEIIEV